MEERKVNMEKACGGRKKDIQEWIRNTRKDGGVEKVRRQERKEFEEKGKKKIGRK